MIIEYILLGVLAPILLNLMHLMVGVYVVVQRGNTMSIGMLFLTWLGVGYLELDMRIFIPLLAFFWFFTHIVEAFVIQHYMNRNGSELPKALQIK